MKQRRPLIEASVLCASVGYIIAAKSKNAAAASIKIKASEKLKADFISQPRSVNKKMGRQPGEFGEM